MSDQSVYLKLMQARVALQGKSLSKSGHNKFAGYKYFELGDFLPAVQEIFLSLNLCGFISFKGEKACLTIVDTETGSSFVIQSPMATANLKGAHDIQNLGAVQTYLRRYLWVTAMEIVEHDALDAVLGQPAASAPARSTRTASALQQSTQSAQAPTSSQFAKTVKAAQEPISENSNEEDDANAFAAVAYEKMADSGLDSFGVKTLLAVLNVKQLQDVAAKHRKKLLSMMTADYAKLLNQGKNSKGEQILEPEEKQDDAAAPSVDELEKALDDAF